MTEQKRAMPKGGRKGGTSYPRISLQQAVEYSLKLVSKTHTGPQSKEIVYPGVFGTSTSKADVRASALRQYGLLKGGPTALDATKLAKQITAAPKEDRVLLYVQACLKPAIAKKVFDTFQSDTVTVAKIRQQVLNFKVHPESADDSVKILVDSFLFSGLATQDGDSITLKQASAARLGSITTEEQNGDTSATDEHKEHLNLSDEPKRGEDGDPSLKDMLPRPRQGTTQVSISIDPSMDPEKLEKLLGVLKKYGQI